MGIVIPILLLSIVFAFELRKYHFDTLIAPLVILIPLIILLFIQLYVEVAKYRTKSNNNKGVASGKKLFSPQFFSLEEPTGVFFWILVFLVTCYLISIPLAGVLFIFLYLKFIYKEKWITSALISLGTFLFIYGIFGWYVGIDFFGKSMLLSQIRW